MLAYNNLDATGFDETTGAPLAGNYVTITYTDANGVQQPPITAITRPIDSGAQYNDAYLVANPGEAYFIPETGELVFGDDLYEDLLESQGFDVSYGKSEFNKSDVRPEHYFDCDTYEIDGNTGNLDVGTLKPYKAPVEQDIRYEINFSQNLVVNTLGCDLLSHSIGRYVDDVENAAISIRESEKRLAEYKQRLADADPNDTDTVEALEKLVEQVTSEVGLKEKVLHDLFGSGLTISSAAEQKATIAITNHGARYVRLEMTEVKLGEQRVQFEDILSENEDIDMGEAYTLMNQADMLYQATLQATSKVLGNSLLNFI